MRFIITIPVRNAENYIERAIFSALSQEYNDFEIMIVDDASTDSTFERICDIALHREYYPGEKIILWVMQNSERRGMLFNHVLMGTACLDDEIIVNLDGDDELTDTKVLQRLASVYTDPNVWMSYGSYDYDNESRNPDPNADPRGIAAQVPTQQHTRQSGWTASHLRTYKRWLFRRICEEDLKRDGEYIQHAIDIAMMSPMLEMAGPQHARYIHDILYQYNAANPLNDHKDADVVKRVQEIEDCMNYIFSQRIYPQLPHEKAYPWTS